MIESKNVTLYSNGCPKCNVLKKKLDEAGVQYDVCAQESELLKMGIDKTPVLSVGENMYDFHDAVKWAESYKNAGQQVAEENKSENLDIKISLDRDFVSKFNSLRESYGDKFAKINGVANTQLNYTDFINNFIDQDTVANATIDPNANAHNKDVCSLMQEMNKSHLKIINYNKVYYELKKKYGLESADKWLALDYSGGTYLHDAASSSMMPYSYKGTETVVVKYNDDIKLVSFEMLYDIVNEEEVLLSERDNAYCKYTENLFVWDKDNSWAKVIRVIRKPKTEEFHFVKASNGVSEIVTSNHPVITADGDKPASSITTNDKIISQPFNMCFFGDKEKIYCLEELKDSKKQLCFKGEPVQEDANKRQQGQVCYFSGTNPIQNEIVCNFDFGWLIGIIIAEGHCNNGCTVISQNKGSIFDNIIKILEDRKYGYYVKKKTGDSDCYNICIRSQVFSDVIQKCFCGKDVSYKKKLSENILQYNKDFIKGLVGGILDGDGTLTQAQGRRIHIRMTSRTLINQLAFLIRMFGYTVREQTPSMYIRDERICQHHYIYHVAFTPYCDVENFDSIKIREHEVEFTSKSLEGRYTNGKYTFGYGDNNVLTNEVLTEDDDEFVYDISVGTGHFMCNNILSHNCFAYDLSDLAKKGLFFIEGFKSRPANHLTTFCDHFLEYTSWVSNRSSGAAGFPNFLVWAYYFWRKDCDEGFYLRSPEYYRDQCFQKVLFDLNQPYLRITQTTFSNFSIFDRIYCEDIFGGLIYPDGTCFIDEVEQFIDFQKAFIRRFKELRRENLFTYPVLTYALVYKDGKFKDEEFARWCSDSNMQWADSNFFINENTGTLSSCCLDAGEMVLTRSSNGVELLNIKEIHNSPYEKYRKNFTVFHNGTWVKAKVIKAKAKKMFKITTANKKEVIVTEDHIIPTNNGDKYAIDISCNDYIAFNTRPLNAVKERDKHLTYEQGFIIGLYAGDGSCYIPSVDSYSNRVIFSLNDSGKLSAIPIIETALSQLEIDRKISMVFNKNHCVNATISSQELYDFVKQYIIGTSAYNKEFNLDCLEQSLEFRKGIIAGWYASDGGNSNRIYSVSKRLIDSGECIFTSLGKNTVVNMDDRTGEDRFENKNGGMYKCTCPLYCIRWYNMKSKRSMGNVYIIKNNTEYFKITSIDPINSSDDYVYCFEMANEDEPYFTLPNGMITHNCRLLNDTTKLDAFINSIGGTALSIGSVKVNTINLMRIAYEAKNKEDYFNILRDRIDICIKTLDCVRHIIQRNVEKGLLPTYSHNLIDMSHQYCTIGINALYEAVKYFGGVTTDEFGNNFYTEDGLKFACDILDFINKVKDSYDLGYSLNIESIPAERAAVCFAQKDNLLFNPDNDEYIYSNQWIALKDKATLQERVKVSSLLDKKCGGGVILHINIDAPFQNEEQAWKALNYVANKGVIYFAFNLRINLCEQNHSFTTKRCPICGGDPVETYQRIVGYLVPTHAYSSERKREFGDRYWLDGTDMG